MPNDGKELIISPQRELARQDAIRVVAAPRPFSVVTIEKIVPAGGTIAEILHSLAIFPPAWTETHVIVRDLPVPRAYWDKVRPKPGTDLVVRVVPRGNTGGGKAVFRIVIAIAGALAGGALLGPALLGAGVLSASAAASVGTAVGGLVGTLAAVALVPPPKQRQPERLGIEKSPQLAASGNEMRPWQPIPDIIGRHRIFPPPVEVLWKK